jgi:5-methylcytosine-specific restriction enzyme subunit McrC
MPKGSPLRWPGADSHNQRSGGVITIHRTAEWRTIELREVTLNLDDRALVASLGEEGKLRIDELRDMVRVESFSWIGVVRFSQFELRIMPKLAGDYAGLLGMLEHVAGIDVFRRLRTPPVDLLEGENNLLDLLALLLCEEVERIVRHGLLADYQEREEDLPVVRGRLLADLQVTRRFGRVDRLECRFDEQLTNIPENQILAAALGACRRRVSKANVQRRVRRLYSLFESECSLEGVNLSGIRASLVYHRLNAAYRQSHTLAWMILDALGIEDLYQASHIRCFAFLLDMNALFEAFVSKWLTDVLKNTGLRISVQRRDRSILWDATRNCSYAAVIPDVLVENPGTRLRLPLDAKYKCYDSRRIDNPDMYQAFLYAFAFNDDLLPQAFLVYPASGPGGEDIRLEVRQTSHCLRGRVVAIRLHIPTALKELCTEACSGRTEELRRQIASCVS